MVLHLFCGEAPTGVNGSRDTPTGVNGVSSAEIGGRYHDDEI